MCRRAGRQKYKEGLAKLVELLPDGSTCCHWGKIDTALCAFICSALQHPQRLSPPSCRMFFLSAVVSTSLGGKLCGWTAARRKGKCKILWAALVWKHQKRQLLTMPERSTLGKNPATGGEK